MRTIPLALVLLLASFTDAMSQDPQQPGQRVRVTVPSLDLSKHQDTFRQARGDTLVLESMWLPLADIARLDVHRGSKRGTSWGVLIGAGIGVGLGAGIGFAIGEDCIATSGALCFKESVTVPVLGLAGGLVGAGLGALIGSRFRSDKWEEGPMPRPRSDIGPAATRRRRSRPEKVLRAYGSVCA